MAYVMVADRDTTTEYDERLTRPIAEDTEIVIGDPETFPCDQCKAPAQFVVWRDKLSPVWGMAGIDGASSDTYGITCQIHTRSAGDA